MQLICLTSHFCCDKRHLTISIMRFLDSVRWSSREELLESGGEFSVEELIDVGLDGKKGDKERRLLFVNDYVLVRLLPLKLLDAVEEHHRSSGLDKIALRVLRAAYFVYRGCVNQSMEAPVYLQNGAWEWPEPVNYHWNDLEELLFMGMLMGAEKRVESARVVTTEEGDVVRSQDLITGVVTSLKVAAIVARPQELVKYQIPRLADVRFVNSMAWKLHSNRVFANGLARAIEDLDAGVADQGGIDDFFSFLFKDLREPTRMPVVRYAKQGEKTVGVPSGNLFILQF